jgi:hypothetical protein
MPNVDNKKNVDAPQGLGTTFPPYLESGYKLEPGFRKDTIPVLNIWGKV